MKRREGITQTFTICALLILFLFCGSIAKAETSEPEDDVAKNTFSYYIDSDTGCLTITGNGQMQGIGLNSSKGSSKFRVIRPWGNDVTSAKRIKRIIIGDGITKVPDGAFSNLSNVTSVELPASLKTIGKYAFYKCSELKTIVIPDNVKSIDKEAFYACNALAQVQIGEHMSSLGDKVFFGCESLCAMQVSSGNEAFVMKNDTLYSSDKKTVYQYLVGIKGSAKMLKTTKKIKNGAYAYGRFSKITVTGRVTSIGEQAFYHCKKLSSVKFPSAVRSVGAKAFYHCVSLRKVTLPAKLKALGTKSFGYCIRVVTKQNGVKIAVPRKMKKFQLTVKKKSKACKYAKKYHISYRIA